LEEKNRSARNEVNQIVQMQAIHSIRAPQQSQSHELLRPGVSQVGYHAYDASLFARQVSAV
jgi:hypothetical protein